MKTRIFLNGLRWENRAAYVAIGLAILPFQGKANSITAIPTLGGMNASCTGLNDAGYVSGFSTLPGEMEQHGFVYGNDASVDLGTLGGAFGIARGLNHVNQIVGDSGTTGDLEFHAFIYSNGRISDLGTLGGTMSTVADINDLGVVVGSSYVIANAESHAFLFDGFSMIDLGTLGGNSSGAAAVNSAGDVVGDSFTTGNTELHPFLYRGGIISDLGTLGGSPAFATGINDSGVIIGESMTGNMQSHGFVVVDGQMKDLGTLGGTWSSAYKINEQGMIAGDSSTFGDNDFHGFVYDGVAMRDIGTLGGTFSTVHDLNDRGQVVGDSADQNQTLVAFMWQEGVMVDLNSLLPADSGWHLWSAQFINNAGQIVGFGLLDGAFSWFLLNTEVPNTLPVADAGEDRNLQCAGNVILDGSGSLDQDGDSLSFEWMQHDQIVGRGVTTEIVLSAGVHAIQLKVTDEKGGSSEDTVVISVADTEPPMIQSCPEPVAIEADHNQLAVVPDLRNVLDVWDNCTAPSDMQLLQSPLPGSQVEVGQHDLTLVAIDRANNRFECRTQLLVTELKCEPVVLSATPLPNIITKRDRKMIPVEIDVITSPECNTHVRSEIIRVSSSDPIIGLSDSTTPDWELTGPLTLNVRAEVAAKSDVRVYSIIIRSSDENGNEILSQAEVSVLRNKLND